MSWWVATKPPSAIGEQSAAAISPALADGTPFPTLYYLTCPRASSAIGTGPGAPWQQSSTSALRAYGDLVVIESTRLRS